MSVIGTLLLNVLFAVLPIHLGGIELVGFQTTHILLGGQHLVPIGQGDLALNHALNLLRNHGFSVLAG